MPRRISLTAAAVTALLLITAAVPLAFVTAPYAHRALRLSQLTHPDPATHERALAYAARHLTHPTHGPATQRAVTDAMVTLINTNQRNTLERFRQTLDTAGLWRRDAVPADVWTDWIATRAADPNPDTRIEAAWMLADLPTNDDTRSSIHGVLVSLAADPDPNVQLNALAAAAELTADPTLRDTMRAVLQSAAND
ncbi:MAG: HEAT repeat domain-containing protein, partial [Planctomycetota bacterium]